MLETRDLTKRFGGLTAVDCVSLSVEPGEIRSIIGPNGAGKTTLFNLISRALAPTRGDVRFKGRSLIPLSPSDIFHLGIVRSFQVPHVFHRLTVRANVRLLAASRLRASASPFARTRTMQAEANRRVTESLNRVGMLAHADRPAGTLAHGDQRLLEIAMALAAAPELLLLDEPTSGMSPEETRRTADLLRQLAPAMTLVIVEHDMSVVMTISDRITVLDRGAVLADGSPDDIRRNSSVQAVYLGRDASNASA
jgi:branched-chain amino acid transport system ATP-binding protein